MSVPSWQIGRPYWELAPLRKQGRAPVKQVKTIRRTAVLSPELIEREAAAGGAILNMHFARFGVWQEINSPTEGHFLERIQRGAFAKSIRESLRNVRAVLSHGKDPSLGQTVLGKVESIEETADAAIARVSLFPSVPPLLLDGLAAEQYGASFRGEPIKSHVEYRPGRSAHNPRGLPEVTRQEIRLRDIGPTPFAAYEGTSSSIQTDNTLVPARSRPAGRHEIERPYWSLADLHGDREPSWKLNRRGERRGRTYAKS